MRFTAPVALLLTALTAVSAAGRELTLSRPEWRLFVPDAYQKPGEGTPEDGAIDLLVHFHGDPATVLRNADAVGLNAAVLVVNYRGLSSVYRVPFEDASLFPTLLDDALASLRRDGALGPEVRWGKIAVSSFSAGYGAVRELLRQPDSAGRIAGVLAADSLYASTAADGTPEDEQMAPYVAYARRAAAGETTFVLTHSAVATPTYESTRETADELLESLGMTVTPIDDVTPGGVRLTRHAEKGRFEVWGAAGDTGDDHMAHLRQIGDWLGDLPLARRGVGEPSAE